MSMSSAEGSLASQCPAPVKGKGRKTKGGSGRSSTGSFAKLNQDGSWSKMYQDCCLLTLDGSLLEFCETFPQAGMMRNGISYRLQVLAHRTSEKECSLWPTPTTRDFRHSGSREGYLKRKGKHVRALNEEVCWNDEKGIQSGGQLNPNWVELLMGYPLGWTEIEE